TFHDYDTHHLLDLHFVVSARIAGVLPMLGIRYAYSHLGVKFPELASAQAQDRRPETPVCVFAAIMQMRMRPLELTSLYFVVLQTGIYTYKYTAGTAPKGWGSSKKEY
ncbi:hypothetical protein B0H34DRAFT_735886, partial [Crassisporium funariophilum]